MVIAALSVNAMPAKAGGFHGGWGHYGGGWHGGYCGWWPFAFGLGLGVAASYPLYAYSQPIYTYPVVTYAYQPGSTYVPAAPATVSAVPASSAYATVVHPAYGSATVSAPVSNESLAISLPASGSWIPDTSPDRYIPPSNLNRAHPANTTVTVTQVGTVPVYVVGR
jgi:hypothetical protein